MPKVALAVLLSKIAVVQLAQKGIAQDMMRAIMLHAQERRAAEAHKEAQQEVIQRLKDLVGKEPEGPKAASYKRLLKLLEAEEAEEVAITWGS